MNHHYVVKLRQRLPDDSKVPDWVDFINDKSRVQESIDAAVDDLFRKSGLKFWVTKEYKPAAHDWSAEEKAQGLDRTYRLILQEHYKLPHSLVEKVALIPWIEDAHELKIGEVKLPAPQVSTQASVGAGVAEQIFLPYAHAFTKGNPDVKIAVLDTGVNMSHPELQGKLDRGEDLVNLEGLDTTGFIGDFLESDGDPEDEVGHGTHVSGIVAARGLQMDGGVAPNCRIMPVRVLATMKSGSQSVGAGIIDNINRGIKWAVDNGADVINMSLGIKHTGGGLPHEDVIRYAISKGVTVVAASGNDGTAERYYPGALPGVIAVGAVDDSGSVTSFTSYGANIWVVAPGVRIYSSFANNTYAFASGTSQASPFVCGAVALMKSYALEQGKRLSNESIRHILQNTSDKVDSRFRSANAGYGLINLADAFKFINYN